MPVWRAIDLILCSIAVPIFCAFYWCDFHGLRTETEEFKAWRVTHKSWRALQYEYAQFKKERGID
jgi:hypothetical protein